MSSSAPDTNLSTASKLTIKQKGLLLQVSYVKAWCHIYRYCFGLHQEDSRSHFLHCDYLAICTYSYICAVYFDIRGLLFYL